MDISTATATADVYFESGFAVEPQITVTMNRRFLTEGTDYLTFHEGSIRASGTYQVTVKGIGAYYGTMYCQVTVLPAMESLPPALTGKQTVRVSLPDAGQTAFIRWKTDTAHCVICKDTPRPVCITVTDANGFEIRTCKGIGYQAAEFEAKPGNEYIISAAFLDGSQTGEWEFSLLPDVTLLDSVDAVIEKAVPYREEPIIPQMDLTDGQYTLCEGVDYEIVYRGGQDHLGRAEILCRGIGRYAGDKKLSYTVYPEDPQNCISEYIGSLTDAEPKASFQWSYPGHAAYTFFTCEESEPTVYSLSLPGTADACTSFVYQYYPEPLPSDRKYFVMMPGETIKFFCVSDWLDSDTDPKLSLSVSVKKVSPKIRYYDEECGCGYRIDFKTAVLTELSPELTGIQIPDSVTEPDTGYIVPFGGISADLLANKALYRHTFYVQAGGAAEEYFRGTDLKYAVLDSASVLRGDVTGDGRIDRQDALMLLRWLTECPGMMLSGNACSSADYNADGVIDLLDARGIMADAETDVPE